MNGFLLGLGIYLVLGVLYIGIRWKRILTFGRLILGDRVKLAIPILILIWPLIFIGWISDEIKIRTSLAQTQRLNPSCQCGSSLHITRVHMIELRDEGQSEVQCETCGELTGLNRQRT